MIGYFEIHCIDQTCFLYFELKPYHFSLVYQLRSAVLDIFDHVFTSNSITISFYLDGFQKNGWEFFDRLVISLVFSHPKYPQCWPYRGCNYNPWNNNPIVPYWLFLLCENLTVDVLLPEHQDTCLFSNVWNSWWCTQDQLRILVRESFCLPDFL